MSFVCDSPIVLRRQKASFAVEIALAVAIRVFLSLQPLFQLELLTVQVSSVLELEAAVQNCQ